MAGCDFLPSLPNIGIKKAHQAIKKFRDFVKVWKGGSVMGELNEGSGSDTHFAWLLLAQQASPHIFPLQACKNFRFSGATVHRDYEQNLQRTLWVFRHQRVYCPRAKALVHVRPLPPGGLGAMDVDVMSAVPQGDAAQALDFLGPMLEDHIAQGIAEGRLVRGLFASFRLHSAQYGCRWSLKAGTFCRRVDLSLPPS